MSNNEEEKDEPTQEPHDCYDKEKAIRAKTGVHLDPQNIHDIISVMCINLNFTNAQEMMDWINLSTKETIEAEISRAKKSLQFAQKKQTKRQMSVYQ